MKLKNPANEKEMIGKTITSVDFMTLKGFDDEGFLRLKFSDGTSCIILGGYKSYTGDSADEYPTYIEVLPSMKGLKKAVTNASGKLAPTEIF